MIVVDRPRTTARAAPWRRVFYGWWMVAGLAVTELVSWGVLVYAFSVLVVPMRAELGWSTAQLNGAYTTGVAVSGLVSHTAGKLAVTVILVAYLTDRGYSLRQATLAAGAVGAFQVLGRLACTALRPWLPAQRTAIPLFAAQAVALTAPLLTTGHAPAATGAVITLVVFFGLGYGPPDLLRGTLLVEYYGPRATSPASTGPSPASWSPRAPPAPSSPASASPPSAATPPPWSARRP